MIYGVFTTPPNSISGSAVCAFRMEDIYKAFDGAFKGQEDINSNWLPIPSSKVPEPRPGQCVNDSRTLPEMTLNFIKEHPLMDLSVPPLWGNPIVIQTSFNYRFTQIAVDPQIETASGKTFDVLFIATDDGRVLKAINSASSAPSGHRHHNTVVPIIIEEITVFSPNTQITNLLVYHTFYEAKLLVVSDSELKFIPLHKCEKRAKSCGECVGMQDPYCAWDISRQLCTSSRSRYWNRDNFVQNVEDGWDPRCPDGRPPSPTESTSSSGNGILPQRSKNHYTPPEEEVDANDNEATSGLAATQQSPYTGETLAFAIVTSVVTSLVVGFIFGYIFSKRCRKDDPNGCSPYDEPTYLDRHTDTFPSGQSANSKPINLVLNVTPKNAKNGNVTDIQVR